MTNVLLLPSLPMIWGPCPSTECSLPAGLAAATGAELPLTTVRSGPPPALCGLLYGEAEGLLTLPEPTCGKHRSTRPRITTFLSL